MSATRIICVAALMGIVGCATTLEPVRPVKPEKPPVAGMDWPEYVEAADVALLKRAEERIDAVRKGELLVTVVDVNGDPIQGAEVRWVQRARDVRFGVEGTFDPGVWGDLVRIGVDQTAATLDWQPTEPEPGVWTTGPTAAVYGLDILPAMGVKARGSAAAWMMPSRTPDWVRGLDRDALLKAVDEHVRSLVGQLEGFVDSWEAVRDPNTEWTRAVGADPELVADVAEVAARAIRDLDPVTPIVVNFAHPFGEAQALPPLHFGERLKVRGVPFEIVGLQYLYNGYTRSAMMPRRSLVEIDATLQQMALLGKPLHVTALSVPSERHPTDPTLAGHWGRRWSPELQAVYLRAFYVMALAHPDVDAIVWQGARDHDTEVVGGGLFEAPGKPRPAFDALRDLLAMWHTEGRAKLGEEGTVRFRGFAGNYRLVVKEPVSGRELSVETRIDARELGAVTVTLPEEIMRPDHVATPWVVHPRADVAGAE